MTARHKARKRALDILFECEIRGTDPVDLLAQREADPEVSLNEYTPHLVRAVVDHRAGLDEVIAQYSQGWTLERMPVVDRCILRLAVWEVLRSEDVPASVAISEAVALAGELSTDASASFVNGVLAHVAQDRPSLP